MPDRDPAPEPEEPPRPAPLIRRPHGKADAYDKAREQRVLDAVMRYLRRRE